LHRLLPKVSIKLTDTGKRTAYIQNIKNSRKGFTIASEWNELPACLTPAPTLARSDPVKGIFFHIRIVLAILVQIRYVNFARAMKKPFWEIWGGKQPKSMGVKLIDKIRKSCLTKNNTRELNSFSQLLLRLPFLRVRVEESHGHGNDPIHAIQLCQLVQS
jgi:hypothetical protein